MKYKKQDYEDMFYDVHTLEDDTDIFEKYPDLLDYKLLDKWSGVIPRSKILKYIVLCYDKNSPFVNQIDSLIERKKEAAKEAVLPTNEFGNLINEAKEILHCKNEVVNEMIFKYCMFSGKAVWAQIVSLSQASTRMYMQLQRGTDEEGEPVNSGTLSVSVSKVDANLLEKKKEFLAQAKDDGPKDGMYDFIEKRVIRISPEDYARKDREDRERGGG